MSHQKFGDESNWKHRPHAEHHVDDKFGKGTETRNWKKNLDETLEASDSDTEDANADNKGPVPPGAPDRTPVEDPEENQKPMGDPQPSSKKKKRLQ